ncbi:hypothetical protein JW992_02150 [candidate division KSB1 bacterium]|nr:hypothetical protein [candidate division KSB1 bacterium]
MNRITETKRLLESVRQLWKQNRFQTAADQLSNFWKVDPPVRKPDLAFAYAYTLYRLKQFQPALQICRIAYRMAPQNVSIRNLYAWIIYRAEIRHELAQDRQHFLKAARAIVRLSSQQDKRSPYTDTVLRVLDLFSEPFSVQAVLEWTSYLNPALLRHTAGQVQSKAPTPKERYYRLRSEALLKNNQSRECLELCQEALTCLNPLRGDDALWFKRKIALSLFALGEFQDALQLLLELVVLRPEWYIEKEIAAVYQEMGDVRSALEYAARAALNGDEIKSKINVYKLLVQLLEKTGQTAAAGDHARLVLAVARTMRWRLRGELTGWIQRFHIELDRLPTPELAVERLKPLWRKIRFTDKPCYDGSIQSLHPNRSGGLVSRSDGRCFVFSCRDALSPTSLHIGTPVTFYLEQHYDRDKDKTTTRAVGLTIQKQ